MARGRRDIRLTLLHHGSMRIGVYIDGYNLYYGGRGLCGRGEAGWRWLDLRAMASRVITRESGWAAPYDLRVVFCTARIKSQGDASGPRDQDTYLRALEASGSVDVIEMGTYVTRTATAPLATADKKGRPVLTPSAWPVMVQDQGGKNVPEATFMVSVARREEKGSDVNVATHLTTDVLRGRVQGAVIVSNDSDLALPVRLARGHVPVGLVNPTTGYRAGALKGQPGDGGGNHWWTRMEPADFTECQLPERVGRSYRPDGW